MKFQSTRNASPNLGFRDAFASGLAPDGGLYLPESLPCMPDTLLNGDTSSYASLAFEFLRHFDTDHSPEELKALIDRSYEGTFDDPATAPLKKLADNLFVLELFHGPTLAFKDFGLQLVGNLFEDQIQRSGQSINVLGATSGDTGSAAIHGLADKKGVNVFILYPKGRISPLQERQMTCTEADNIFPIPIEGSFDDAQLIVKELFGDLEFKAQVGLSAINSINLARVLAQSIYYFHAWAQLPQSARANDPTFVVPTGNFGNILAGWLAGKMGLPAQHFSIATNRNDILYKLFTTGRYQVGEVHSSLAPSMDIQVASNFERFLFYQLNGDGKQVAELMQNIKQGADLQIPDFDCDSFAATHSSDQEITALIRQVYEKYDYIVDPHTACAFKDLDPSRTNIVLSTAHPAKFPDTIEQAIAVHPTHPALEKLKSRTPVCYEKPAQAKAIREFILANQA
ncbi:MAG: threonine synthase [Verrucomicrobiales bacterium]|nr:threonine synthase [Verrucomicrobiales bacterium]